MYSISAVNRGRRVKEKEKKRIKHAFVLNKYKKKYAVIDGGLFFAATHFTDIISLPMVYFIAQKISMNL